MTRDDYVDSLFNLSELPLKYKNSKIDEIIEVYSSNREKNSGFIIVSADIPDKMEYITCLGSCMIEEIVDSTEIDTSLNKLYYINAASIIDLFIRKYPTDEDKETIKYLRYNYLIIDDFDSFFFYTKDTYVLPKLRELFKNRVYNSKFTIIATAVDPVDMKDDAIMSTVMTFILESMKRIDLT